jgi:hypothetical protein
MELGSKRPLNRSKKQAICSDFSEARNETRTRDPFLTIHERWATLLPLKVAD